MKPTEHTTRKHTTARHSFFPPSNISSARQSLAHATTFLLPIDGRSVLGSRIEKRLAHPRKELFIQQGPGMVLQRVTIGSLPDNILLEIFYLYRLSISCHDGPQLNWHRNWHKLVHVCGRWRDVVFASPIGLDLRLLCTQETPVRQLLNIWPELPLVIYFRLGLHGANVHTYSEDKRNNLIASLECRGRVSKILISGLSNPLSERIFTMMQESFPAVTLVTLRCLSGHVAVLPAKFLNGSAPCLQGLILEGIVFPSLRRFLLSTSELTILRLYNIPDAAYISSEAMATSLSVMTKLEWLSIEFQSPTPQPKRRNRRPPPLTRSVLSALTQFVFKGVSEYLEILTARIEAPLINYFRATLFNQLVFDIPQVSRFIGHPEFPKPSGLSLRFRPGRDARIIFSWPQRGSKNRHHLMWKVICNGLDWQVFSVAQICNHILPLCSSVEWLCIEYGHRGQDNPPLEIRPDDMDPMRWRELFNSFISVNILEISDELEPFIAAAFQGLTEESAGEVFPALHSLSVVGNTSDRAAQQTEQSMESFVTTRRDSDHPIAFHRSNHWAQGDDQPPRL